MLITTVEAAARLGVTRGWVHRLVQRRIIPATRVGRDWLIQEADVEAAKERRGLGWTPGKARKPKKPELRERYLDATVVGHETRPGMVLQIDVPAEDGIEQYRQGRTKTPAEIARQSAGEAERAALLVRDVNRTLLEGAKERLEEFDRRLERLVGESD